MKHSKAKKKKENTYQGTKQKYDLKKKKKLLPLHPFNSSRKHGADRLTALQLESTKGPPEFPGLIAVSVLRSSRNVEVS